MNNAVAKIYPPINGSTKIINGIPAIENPNMNPYPQYLFLQPIITPGILEIKIIDKKDQISIKAKINNILNQEITPPIKKNTTVPISNLNSGSILPKGLIDFSFFLSCIRI